MNIRTDFVSRAAAHQIAEIARADRLRDQKLSLHHLHHALMLPVAGYAGLYANGHAIATSYFSCAAPVRDVLPDGILQDVPVISEPVFYLGKFNVCWGHCITDGLKFLWPFLKLDIYPELKNCKIVYTTLSRTDNLPENFLQILSVLGIDSARLQRVDYATYLKECYFADECFSSMANVPENEHSYSCEYCDVVESICKHFRRVGNFPKKVYLTKRGWKGWVKGEYGENLLENAFASSGYKIISPESVPFKTFVAMMQSAEVVASTECSCSHNSLFMSKGAKLVLLRKYDRVNSYQMTINQVRDLDVCYVDVGMSPWCADGRNRSAGPFFMYVSRCLSDYLHVRAHFPLGLFLRYVFSVAWRKSCLSLYTLCYRAYKLIIVGALRIDKWERGKLR